MRLSVLRRDQATLYGEGADPGEDIATVLRIGDDRAVDEDLQEEIVDVDARPHRAAHDRDLGGQRIAAAEAVDLARIWRAHDAEKQRVARGRIGG